MEKTMSCTSGQSVQKSPELTEGLFLMDGIEGLRSPPPSFGGYALNRSALRHHPELLGCAVALAGAVGGGEMGRQAGGRGAVLRAVPYDKVLGASNLSMLLYEWVWYKSRCTGFLNARRAPLKKTENILVF